MTVNWKREAPCLVILAAMFGVSAWAWPEAADRIAIHANWAGNVDGYGGKFAGLLVLPLAATVLYLVTVLWPRFDPRHNFDMFARPYTIIRSGILGLMLAIHAGIAATAIGWQVNGATAMAMAAGALIALLGNYLPKIEPNWIMGVRTPWTLSSDLSWHKTHRLAGPLLVGAGFIDIVAAAMRPKMATPVMLGTLIFVALVSVVYSYLVWRQDPARHRPDETQTLLH